MNSQELNQTYSLIKMLVDESGAWPNVAPLDEEFGFRIYGYGRAPERVWLWIVVTFCLSGLAGWFGWLKGGVVGERFFNFLHADIFSALFFSLIFIAGTIAFIRTIGLRFFERLIEPRFELILTRDAVELGGWFGYKRYERHIFSSPGFKVEPHSQSSDESLDFESRGNSGMGVYGNTMDIVFKYRGDRKKVTSIFKDQAAISKLHYFIFTLDREFKLKPSWYEGY